MIQILVSQDNVNVFFHMVTLCTITHICYVCVCVFFNAFVMHTGVTSGIHSSQEAFCFSRHEERLGILLFF